MLRAAVVVLAAACCGLGWAQVQSVGRFRPVVACPIKAGSIRDTRIYSLPSVNNMFLLMDAESEESSISLEDPQEDQLKPYKFAETIPLSLDIHKDGVWEEHEEAGYRVWRATVISRSAHSLGLVFQDFFLPEGGELYVIGQDRILGAFLGDVNNKPNGRFATMPLPGEELLLEYYEPLAKEVEKCGAGDKLGFLLRRVAGGGARTPAKRPAARLEPQEVRMAISGVTHGFRPYTKNFGDSQSCNIDVACEKSLAGKRQINSVAMLLTADGTRVCTGAFVNNVAQDGRQLFLTAKHCMNEDPSNFILVFNYQVATCGDRSAPPPIQSVHGMTLLNSWAQSDFAIAEVKERIPDSYNVYMAGWDLSPDPPARVYTIHHPTGDVKKISYYDGTTLLSHWFEAPRTFHWKVPSWTRGSTERGSSGAPLFNGRGLIVGHLHGGSASCLMPNGFDNFGGLYFDWASGPTKETRLRDVLNPVGKAVTALRGSYLKDIRKHRHSSSDDNVHGHHHHHHHQHRHHQRRSKVPSIAYETAYSDQSLFAPSYHYPDDQHPQHQQHTHTHAHQHQQHTNPNRPTYTGHVNNNSFFRQLQPQGKRDQFRNKDVIDMLFH